ncbi:unnamed protein product [marine sediment metagenome]|uniref:Uncharacterized protein n=1 Tax=marine sediment metagenome TaxID=412755 RepID=X1FRD4_9ZZZZ
MGYGSSFGSIAKLGGSINIKNSPAEGNPFIKLEKLTPVFKLVQYIPIIIALKSKRKSNFFLVIYLNILIFRQFIWDIIKYYLSIFQTYDSRDKTLNQFNLMY